MAAIARYMGRMADNQETPRESRRGAKPGSRKGTEHEGKAGNLPYVPTADDRAKVEKMAGLQISQEDIAMVMGLHRNSIQNHFAEEFARGRAMMGIRLREHAYTQAFGKLKDPDKPEDGYVPEFKPDPKMTQFMLERQFGMVPQIRQEHVGDPTAPLEITHIRRMVIDPKAPDGGE